VEAAVRRTLSDDALVDCAAEENLQVAEERLDRERIRPMAIDFYKQARRAAEYGRFHRHPRLQRVDFLREAVDSASRRATAASK
jgi:hypothetical protein